MSNLLMMKLLIDREAHMYEMEVGCFNIPEEVHVEAEAVEERDLSGFEL